MKRCSARRTDGLSCGQWFAAITFSISQPAPNASGRKFDLVIFSFPPVAAWSMIWVYRRSDSGEVNLIRKPFWSIAWDASCVLIIGTCYGVICLIGLSSAGVSPTAALFWLQQKVATAPPDLTPATAQADASDKLSNEEFDDIEHGPPELSSRRALQLVERTMKVFHLNPDTPRIYIEDDVQIRELPTLTDDNGATIRRWLVQGALWWDNRIDEEPRKNWSCGIGHFEGAFAPLGVELTVGRRHHSWDPAPSEMGSCIERRASARLEEVKKLRGGRDLLQKMIDDFPFTRARYGAYRLIAIQEAEGVWF